MKNFIKLSALLGTFFMAYATTAQTTNNSGVAAPPQAPTPTVKTVPPPTTQLPRQTEADRAAESARDASAEAQREATSSPSKLPAPSGGVAIDADGKPRTGVNNQSPAQVADPRLPVREVPTGTDRLPAPNTNVPSTATPIDGQTPTNVNPNETRNTLPNRQNLNREKPADQGMNAPSRIR